MSVPWISSMAEIQAKFHEGVAGLYRAKGFDKHVSEAPRRETPCQVESGTVVSHDATRPCGDGWRRRGRSLSQSTAGHRQTPTRMLRQRGHVGYEACFMLSIPRRMKTRIRT